VAATPATVRFVQDACSSELDDVDLSASSSPAGALDWRGYATVRAIDVLRRNGAVDEAGPPRLEASPAA
jgi:hypothetical protein